MDNPQLHITINGLGHLWPEIAGQSEQNLRTHWLSTSQFLSIHDWYFSIGYYHGPGGLPIHHITSIWVLGN